MESDAKAHFQQLVNSGRPVGEIIAVNKFLVRVKGLQPVTIHSQVVFEDGSKGFVQQILEDQVLVLHTGASQLTNGMIAVVSGDQLLTKVGKDFIGRIISVNGDPLDGKGAIAADAAWPIFNGAPPIYERELLNTQLETGITGVDALFPMVRGQRLALLGDSKSGKSTMATQIAINQRSTDQVVVYVLIAKRRSDIDNLITQLSENKALDKAVVVVSTVFDSLVNSYLAPYVGCALAEYLWQNVGLDTVVIYDDLTAHAHAHREISLLSGVSPGRDSYPGDMFHAHSSLLERAGRLKRNHKCLTAIPLVLADGGDITAFLPTNVMSITDGQWILDMDVFRGALRPALSVGLSVTRVGTRGHNQRQKQQRTLIYSTLTAFAQALEFSRFGSELAPEAQHAVAVGQKLNQLMTQVPGETYTLMAQQLMLDIVLSSETASQLDIAKLKQKANLSAAQVKNDADYQSVRDQLRVEISLAAGVQPK